MTIRTICTHTTVKAVPATRRKRNWSGLAAWRKSTTAWLQRYPVCVLCLCRGHINQGSIDDTLVRGRTLIVDHIEAHRGDDNLFWDQGNWQTLCRTPCHNMDKQRHERAGKTGLAWMKYLRQVVADGKREEFIALHRQLLPQHIVDYLTDGLAKKDT